MEYIRVQRRYSARTVELYRSAIEGFCSFACPEAEGELSEVQLKEILKPTLIRGYIAQGLEEGLSARTMNLRLSALSSFCNWLVRTGFLESNPVKKVFRPKEARPLPQFYTQPSMEALIEKEEDLAATEAAEAEDGKEPFGDLRTRMIILTLYSTGMRRAELCGLKVGDFDSGRQVLRVTGKGDKTREIPVPDRICKELLLYLKRLKEETGADADGWFFVTDKGKQLYPAFVNNVVSRALTGEEGFSGKKSPHVLRHSLATHLLNNGADINSIKEVLGHASLAATQVYTHNSFEQLKQTYLTAHPRAKKRR